ncbi:MAG TPA: efflux RND transporter periplasmic adaptor subunit [Patescibacteria group bacterium]|nr:efflux RND transporter periplasmic adaptor subunit [Patescibacteria group bacterium]
MRHLFEHVKTHKKFLFIPVALLLFFILRFFVLQQSGSEIIYTVERGNLVDTIQVSGTYQTASQTEVISPSHGILTKLYVENGDMVKKGDKLFHVESTATEEQKKSAYAAYLAASSTLKADEAALYSLQSVMYAKWKTYTDTATNSTFENDDGSPTDNRTLTEFTTKQDDWLAAEANFKNQQAVIAKSQAALTSAKQLYDQTQSVTVTAPTNGTIVNLLVKENDEVTAAKPLTISGKTVYSTAPEAVLTVANLSNPYLAADVNEEYAARIEKDQPATIVFDAKKEEKFSGYVATTATVGVNSQGIVSFPTRIKVNDVPKTIKPGMTALITIETLRKNDVISVPNSALIKKDDNYFVQTTTTKRLISVTLGVRGASKTEITNGLSVGNKIIANPKNEN